MKKIISGVILVGIDVVLYYLALWAAFSIRKLFFGQVWFITFQRPESVRMSQFIELYWIPVIFIVFYLYEGLYSTKKPYWLDLKSMLKACVLSAFASYAIMGFVKMPIDFSRFVLVVTSIFWFLFSAGAHNVLRKIFFRLRWFTKRTALLGGSKFFGVVIKSLHENTYLNYRVKTWVSTDTSTILKDEVTEVINLSEKINWKKVAKDCPYLVVSEQFSRKHVQLIQDLLLLFDEIFIIPDTPLESFINTDVLFLFSSKVFLTRVHNNLKNLDSRVLKWLFDKVVGFVLFVITSPILAIIAVVIKLDSKGKVFISRDNPACMRIGFRNKDFYDYKFRTMFIDKGRTSHEKLLNKHFEKYPDEIKNWKIYKKLKRKDPRVTRVGKLLRTTSLDTLSELISIVKGDMSLVGPRPYLPREREDMTEYIGTITSVKPGMTGLWQVSGRTELTFKERMRLDVWYIHNWSLWLDIIILLKTAFAVVSKVGAR